MTNGDDKAIEILQTYSSSVMEKLLNNNFK